MKAKVSDELRKILQDPDASKELIRNMLARDKHGQRKGSFNVRVGKSAFSVSSGSVPSKKAG
jgi:hypothetical protein